MPYITIKNWKIKIVRSLRSPKKKTKKPSARVAQMRKQAKIIVKERLEHFAPLYGLEYKKVFIKNQKTRWGSCSSKGNLNFNYRIAVLPPELQDYLIVHELCHLKEMNHGPNFWKLMGEQIPNCRSLNRQLKTYLLR